jgi:MFS family permease
MMLVLLSVLSFLSALNGALWIMLDYPIMVRTISPQVRGRMFAILTTAYGLLAVVLGVLSAKCLRELAFPTGYILFFAIAAGFSLVRAAAYSRQRELPDLSVPGASTSALPFSSILRVLKLREFQILAGPHVVRGLCAGLAGFAIPVALKHLALPDSTPGFATSANQAACILGGVGLGFIADRWGAGCSTLLGDVLLGGAMVLLLLSPNLAIFLVLYFLLHFGRNIEDSAVPFGTTIIVPPEHLGAFSAARLMVLQGSSAVGALLFGFCFDNCDPVVLFALGGLMKLLNGVWFWIVFQQPPRKRE